MSLEQSKKIVEAGGATVYHDFPYGYCPQCGVEESGFARSTTCTPDFSLPENRHLLIEYVEQICDTDEKLEAFGSYLELTTHYRPLQEITFPYLWRAIGRAAIALNEKYITALCRVIDESQ